MNRAIGPIKVNESIVKCDGGGPLGHPVIYLNLGKEGRSICPYCGKTFVKATEEKETS